VISWWWGELSTNWAGSVVIFIMLLAVVWAGVAVCLHWLDKRNNRSR
jgi:hypothetical protein